MVIDALTIVSFVFLVIYKLLLTVSAKFSGGIVEFEKHLCRCFFISCSWFVFYPLGCRQSP